MRFVSTFGVEAYAAAGLLSDEASSATLLMPNKLQSTSKGAPDLVGCEGCILLALPFRRLAGQQHNSGRKEKYLSFCNISSVLCVVLHVHPHARVTKTKDCSWHAGHVAAAALAAAAAAQCLHIDINKYDCNPSCT